MTALVLREDQDYWDDKQLAALKQLGLHQASNADLAIYFHQCQRTGLDPFAKQIYMVERAGRQTIQTGIDGYRLVARRAADRHGHTLGYEDTAWCDGAGVWHDVWLSKEPPAAARVVVIRDGGRYPAVALFTEYNAGGRSWQNMPALMLAKCAEALALRKAFPQDLSGIYTADEMAQADKAPTPVSAVKDPQAIADAAVAATTREELLALYQEAKTAGVLRSEVAGAAGVIAELGELIIQLGSDLAKPKADDEVVDAKIVWPDPVPAGSVEAAAKVAERKTGAVK